MNSLTDCSEKLSWRRLPSNKPNLSGISFKKSLAKCNLNDIYHTCEMSLKRESCGSDNFTPTTRYHLLSVTGARTTLIL